MTIFSYIWVYIFCEFSYFSKYLISKKSFVFFFLFKISCHSLIGTCISSQTFTCYASSPLRAFAFSKSAYWIPGNVSLLAGYVHFLTKILWSIYHSSHFPDRKTEVWNVSSLPKFTELCKWWSWVTDFRAWPL